jgi:hypothetical protein
MAQVDEIHQQELTNNTAVSVETFRSAVEAIGSAMEDLSNTVAEQQEQQAQPVEQYDNVDPVVEQNEVQKQEELVVEQIEAQQEAQAIEEPIVEQSEVPQEVQSIEKPVVDQSEVQLVEDQKVEEPVVEQIEVPQENVEPPVEVQPIQSQNPFDIQITEESRPEDQATPGEIFVIPLVNDSESIPLAEAPKTEAETIDETPQIVDEVTVQEGQAVVEGEENLSYSEENAEMEEYYRQVQNEEYVDDDLEDVSLNDQDSLDACSDTSSQKIKKVGKVRQGFKQIFGGTKQIFVGSGSNIKKGTTRTANKGRDAIKGGANFVSDTASSAADSTINAAKSVGGAIKDGTVTVAKATAGAVSDVATGTKDVIVTGACLGVGATVLGAQAIGRGTTAVAGAIKDGAVSAGGAVVDGVKYTGSGIASTVSDIAHAGKDSVCDVLDTGKAGVRAVEHGIETAAMKSAAAIQQNTVKALTLGLKMADGSLVVTQKAIEAPAPPEAIEAPIEQDAIALPPPETN